jgi:hypothetical protein
MQEYNSWSFVYGHMRSGELEDDVKRHGCHNIFWCYPFEREIYKVMNISFNKKKVRSPTLTIMLGKFSQRSIELCN